MRQMMFEMFERRDTGFRNAMRSWSFFRSRFDSLLDVYNRVCIEQLPSTPVFFTTTDHSCSIQLGNPLAGCGTHPCLLRDPSG
ncbi:MAG: hypothetical protein OJF51_000622 [Nitrospira sp.]|jgi:hypothetical protein|nr:MAG: hypothetical protein OJF51_000622 [Nitrospira sp.]